jgi:hypothetical protein
VPEDHPSARGDVDPSRGGFCIHEVDDQIQVLWGNGSNDVYAVGNARDPASYVVLHFDGGVWQVVHAGDGSGLGGVAGRSASDVCAVGGWEGEDGTAHSLVLHFDGASWTEIPSGLDHGFSDVWPRGPEEYVAVGSYDTLATIKL